MPSAEGPLGLPETGVDARGRERREVVFATRGALRIEEILPAGATIDPDDVSLSIRFSTPLLDRRARGEDWRWPITIDPPIASFPRTPTPTAMC